MCSAIHTKSRSWLRSSSTREPSDPLLRVVIVLIPAPSPGRSSYCVQRKCSGTTTPRRGKRPPTNLPDSMVCAVRHLSRALPCQLEGHRRPPPFPGNRTPSGMRSQPRARLTRRVTPTRGIAARSKTPSSGDSGVSQRRGPTPKVRRARAGASLQT